MAMSMFTGPFPKLPLELQVKKRIKGKKGEPNPHPPNHPRLYLHLHLLPIIITILLNLLLLLLRTARRPTRSARNNIVARIGVRNALGLFLVASSGRFDLQRVVVGSSGRSGLCESGGAGGSLVRSGVGLLGSRGLRVLGGVVVFVVIVPGDILFVLGRGVCGFLLAS